MGWGRGSGTFARARGPSPPAPHVTLAQAPRTQVSPPPATLGVLKLISDLPQSQGLDFWTLPSPDNQSPALKSLRFQWRSSSCFLC